MSFRLFIYYCALCGGWAAFFGWILGRLLSPHNALGNAGIKGMFLGMLVALGLSLVDALWNVSFKQAGLVLQRVGVAVLVGCVGGLLGGIIGQALYGVSAIFFVFGWTLTGALVGTSIGVFELLSGIIRQQDIEGAKKKLLKGLIGGTTGGLLGGILALLLRTSLSGILRADPDYQYDYEAILKVMDAADRIPYGDVDHQYVFNFWQDAGHPKGLWRRTSVADYARAEPAWEVGS